MQTAAAVFGIWTCIAWLVLLIDAFRYRDVDFAMRTDFPHWSDSGWGQILFLIITLPLHVMVLLLVLLAAIFAGCRALHAV